MKSFLKKIMNYSKKERIERLIFLSLKDNQTTTMLDYIEIEMIQSIRKLNGEI